MFTFGALRRAHVLFLRGGATTAGGRSTLLHQSAFLRPPRPSLRQQPREWIVTSAFVAAKKKGDRRKASVWDNLKKKAAIVQSNQAVRKVEAWQSMTPTELAKALGLQVDDLAEVAVMLPKDAEEFLEILDRTDSPIKDPYFFNAIGKKLSVKFIFVRPPDQADEEAEEADRDIVTAPPDPAKLRPRPPVVAIMGHIDHGKTTLLDRLRQSRIVDGEFGGITQHIGAFTVDIGRSVAGRQSITFIDTPGHAAFKKMRFRGASATDIVILVVDANEGVLEQTAESIEMIKAAGTPMVVALNKIDKPGADPDEVRRQLRDHGVQLEAFGGDVQSVPISALKGTHVDRLMEAVLVQAELMQLQADYDGPVEGVVIESSLETGLGKTASVLVTRGTLKRQAHLVAGTCVAKVKRLFDDRKADLHQVGPAEAARVASWDEIPHAGLPVHEVESEKRAREVSRWRTQQDRKLKAEIEAEQIEAVRMEHQKEHREFLKDRFEAGRMKFLNFRTVGDRYITRQKEIVSDPEADGKRVSLVIKADVDGSLEAIINCIDSYMSTAAETDGITVDIVDFGVGPVTETDVRLAKDFNGLVFAFNTAVPQARFTEAAEFGVAIREHNVIYKLVDNLRSEIDARMPLIEVEDVVAKAKVAQEFEINVKNKKVPVAGCRVVSGKLARESVVKVLRGGNPSAVAYEGRLSSLKHLKDEVSEVTMGKECGLMLQDPSVRFVDGDLILVVEKRLERTKTQWNPGF